MSQVDSNLHGYTYIYIYISICNLVSLREEDLCIVLSTAFPYPNIQYFTIGTQSYVNNIIYLPDLASQTLFGHNGAIGATANASAKTK